MKILAKKRLLAKKSRKSSSAKVDVNGFGPKTAAFLYKVVQETNASLPKKLYVDLSELRKEFKHL